eukprot:Cvel_3583.t4-p1 / transcript=Cvel_3583.t4 / gene=Cvel_3583 / organism=Chromera_velia_CCMP2878 / gene_product=hypothetical protein / transcript_product=hypothetical protein / location=Cvel_scaffold146:100062-101834(+) / protein_length=311 / sequence_SO=supercontig / SO=protein_coding / is_pseudo=false
MYWEICNLANRGRRDSGNIRKGDARTLVVPAKKGGGIEASNALDLQTLKDQKIRVHDAMIIAGCYACCGLSSERDVFFYNDFQIEMAHKVWNWMYPLCFNFADVLSPADDNSFPWETGRQASEGGVAFHSAKHSWVEFKKDIEFDRNFNFDGRAPDTAEDPRWLIWLRFSKHTGGYAKKQSSGGTDIQLWDAEELAGKLVEERHRENPNDSWLFAESQEASQRPTQVLTFCGTEIPRSTYPKMVTFRAPPIERSSFLEDLWWSTDFCLKQDHGREQRSNFRMVQVLLVDSELQKEQLEALSPTARGIVFIW